MSRMITPEDFIDWAKEKPSEWEEFFWDQLLPIIEDLENEDYFGTEGFDKRFS